MFLNPTFRHILLICILAYVFFFLGNGLIGLSHPDEVFYTQTAKEMIDNHSWLVPYLFDGPNFEKPILSYWLFMGAFSLLGVGSFSARFFPAVFGTIGVIGIYFLGKKAFDDERKGLYAALVLMSSLLYIGLSRTVFTDMFFTVFIELALTSFYYAYVDASFKKWGMVFFWIFTALAVLTKGILGLAIPLLVIVIFLGLRKELRFIKYTSFWIGVALFAVIALPWYVFVIINYGQSFIQEFFYNDHFRRIVQAEHLSNDTWYFYPISTIGLMAPWSIFLIRALWKLPQHLNKNTQPIYLFLTIWIAVVFVIFQAAHSKLISYIFPLFPVLALLTGDYLKTAVGYASRRLFTFSAIIFPVAIISFVIYAALKFSHYLPSLREIIIQIGIYLCITYGIIFLICRKDTPANRIIIVIVQIPLILGLAFNNHKAYENYVSAEEPCHYLLRNYNVKGPIICSKRFLRSTRFFTDKEVIMLNSNGQNKFFSPHPVKELSLGSDIGFILNKQPLLYGIVTKGDVGELKKVLDGKYEVDELAVIADEHIVRIRFYSKRDNCLLYC